MLELVRIVRARPADSDPLLLDHQIAEPAGRAEAIDPQHREILDGRSPQNVDHVTAGDEIGGRNACASD